MIDLREYKDLIRKAVSEENKKDENWKWSVRAINKHEVRIYWSYLEGETNDCFIIKTFACKTPEDEEYMGTEMWCYNRYEDDLIAQGSSGGHSWDTHGKVEDLIKWCIRNIAYYAHTRY